MDDQVAEERNRTRLMEIEKSQNQWVRPDQDDGGYDSYTELAFPTSEEELERFASLLTPEATRNTGGSDRRDASSPPSEEKDEDGGKCFASYYPMIGVFKSNRHLEKAFEKIKRPGERIEVESQIFDTPERAVGAIQGRHPDFVMNGMNEFKMARIKESPTRWLSKDALMGAGAILVMAFLIYTVQREIGTKVDAMPARPGTQAGEGWMTLAEGAGAEREV